MSLRALRASLGVLALPAMLNAEERSETDVAAQFFEAGAAAARRGDFRACAEAFTEAHRRAPHGASLYNAALCWDGAKDRARAANDYFQALRLGGLSDPQVQQAKKRLAELEDALGKLELVEPRGSRASVGPIDQTPIPFETFVEPGEHEVRLEGSAGELITTTVAVEAGQRRRVKLDPGHDADDARRAAPAPTPRRDSSDGLQRTLGWGLIGASAAAAGAGLGYYASALAAKRDFDDSGRQNASAREDALDRYAVARALWLGAAVGAAAGVTLVLTAPRKTPGASAALRLRLHPRGARAEYTF